MNTDAFDRARLLARFKLAVRRQLDQSVDLDRLVNDPAYARARLAEIEDAALDEELLVMLLTVREAVLPRAPIAPAPAATPPAPPVAPAIPPAIQPGLREYKFGARGG